MIPPMGFSTRNCRTEPMAYQTKNVIKIAFIGNPRSQKTINIIRSITISIAKAGVIKQHAIFSAIKKIKIPIVAFANAETE